MKVRTTRFGEIEYATDDVYDFPEGLVGMSLLRRFILLTDAEHDAVLWLQSVERGEFTFALTLAEQLPEAVIGELSLTDRATLRLPINVEPTVLVILNKIAGGHTANLRGPIYLNPALRLGKQIVLGNAALSLRAPVRLDQPLLAGA